MHVMKKIFLVMLLGSLSVLSAIAQEDDMMDEIHHSYYLCEWGLLTIEQSTAQAPIFLEITSPDDYSAVGTSFTVTGIGAGLFEGNVIVEVSGDEGVILFEGTTILQTEEIGATGDWSIDIDLGDMDGASIIFIRVYSSSPEDGSTTAYDDLRLNANAQFGLPYVEITTPYTGAGVNTSPLLVEGMAGAAFENNIVVQVRDFETGEILAEAPASIQTDELAGSGAFSVELSFEAEIGRGIEVYAYQPPVADTDVIEVSDIEFAIVSPLAQTYDRFLIVQRDDVLANAEDICNFAETEFDNTNTDMLVINDVAVLSTRSMMPLVNVSIEAAGSSNCAAPLRTRITRTGDAFAIEVYRDTTVPIACTMDLSPIPIQVSLGTLATPDFTIMVNGEAVD
ncbi:MAG: hypothetical protein KC615_01420 [Anaerolineae bacterium]|nr:hypothetical protein [Anaerolineae bacterium]